MRIRTLFLALIVILGMTARAALAQAQISAQAPSQAASQTPAQGTASAQGAIPAQGAVAPQAAGATQAGAAPSAADAAPQGAAAPQAAATSPARAAFDAFEVAAIKPVEPEARAGRYMKMQGAHEWVATHYTLMRLIGAAYNLNPDEISGGPAWFDSDVYDIVAKTPGDVTPNVDEQMGMLRALLAERFKLTYHLEQKDMPVYVLALAKSGAKLKESTAAVDEQPVLINHVYPDHVELPARNATMRQFASMMGRAVMDRPVLDRTGLTARYDFDLAWTPNETEFSGMLPMDTSQATQPDLFAALQEQLGLRMEATRGPVDVLVVDHAEKPSAN